MLGHGLGAGGGDAAGQPADLEVCLAAAAVAAAPVTTPAAAAAMVEVAPTQVVAQTANTQIKRRDSVDFSRSPFSTSSSRFLTADRDW